MRKMFSALLILLLLSGCTVSEARRSTFAMNTMMSIAVYGSGCERSADGALELIAELDKKWSVTDEGSEVYALNHTGEAQLSEETEELIRFALEMHTLTEGALDITLYPVLREWGFTTGEYRVPSQDELSRLMEYTGVDKLTLTEGSAQLASGAQIDLGAVAKGYAGDLLCEYLRSQGVESALLDLGGNIHAIGSRPDGSAWRLGVRDPFTEGTIAVLELSDKAAVTSGGYERYFVGEDGQRYSHILDPETGRPADSGLASVTVVAEEGRLCDALSTAVYVMGAERGCALQKQHGGFELLVVTNEGDILLTEGLSGSVTASENFSGDIIVVE